MTSAVENAAYLLVHASRDRSRELSERTGIGQQILIHKVDPNNERNHLTLDEAVRCEKASGDFRILYAHADELGHVCIPKLATMTAGDVPHALARMCAEFGDYLREIDAALADGEVSPNERLRLVKELSELIASAGDALSVVSGGA